MFVENDSSFSIAFGKILNEGTPGEADTSTKRTHARPTLSMSHFCLQQMFSSRKPLKLGSPYSDKEFKAA